MISNTCKYGIRSLVYIAYHAKEKKKIGIKKIAEELEIPTPFLGKILQMLSRTGYLKSTKGPNGGFELGKNPYKVNLHEIIVLIDGDSLFNSCIAGIKKCDDHDDTKNCAIHEDFYHIRKQLEDLMISKTIGDLADGIDAPNANIEI